MIDTYHNMTTNSFSYQKKEVHVNGYFFFKTKPMGVKVAKLYHYFTLIIYYENIKYLYNINLSTII